MRVVVVDDEPAALQETAALVRTLRPESHVESYSDPFSAAEAAAQGADVAILDIAMPGLSGLELALEFKSRRPDVNLIFATRHPEYAADAFKLRASGYLLKPVQSEDLSRELDCLRNPLPAPAVLRPVIRTFGNFDVFVNGEPVTFHRRASKEICAYLTDRQGAAVTTRELASILWEDRPFDLKMSKNLSNIIAELLADLEHAGIGSMVGKRRGELFLRKDDVDCDYFRFLAGDEQARAAFRGEYMTQYSWSEYTLGSLLDEADMF